jgi:hypothetical protein
MTSSPASIVSNRRGSVMVEFIIAFMPIFTLFLSVCELANLYASKLVVAHAAYRTARAGAVVFPDDPANYSGTATKLDDVKAAGRLVLRAKGSIVASEIEIPGGTEYAPGQPVLARVSATHRCVFPVADRLVCGFKGGTRILTSEVRMPAHAARYPYSE